MFGVPATVVLPIAASKAKRLAAEQLGARIVLAGVTTEERMSAARTIAAETGAHIVPPYDHPSIIAGHGTCGLEIIADLPSTRVVIVPVGGGGLASGVAVAVKGLDRNVKVIAVEPAGAAKLTRAFEHGGPVQLDRAESIADGLLPLAVGDCNYTHLAALIDAVVTVTDEEIREAIRFLLKEKLAPEPSGAVTTAALLAGKIDVTGDVVAVLSGGNVSDADLQKYQAGAN